MTPDFPCAYASYSAIELLADPRFRTCLAASASELLATHSEIPREVRYVADLQKWVLSQATLALHFTHQVDCSAPRLSPTALLRSLEGTGIASRNTLNTFLQEMVHYGLAAPLPSPDRRQRSLIATPLAEALISRWTFTHIVALDQMDQGDRSARFAASPAMIRLIQPKMTQLLLGDPEWLAPKAGVGLFTHSGQGSNLLHHMLSHLPWDIPNDWVEVGRITARDLAAHYLISQSHISRLLQAAEKAGLLRWRDVDRRGPCEAATHLVHDYRAWQAAKFAALSTGFKEAASQLDPACEIPNHSEMV